ncbi:MAG: MFS transporter [Dehalococcoidia bacterium]
MKRRGLWANDDFLKLWIGETISILGSFVGRTALAFTAVLVLDASAIEVGLLVAADIVPGLAFGFLAGVWVDRFNRRPIMIAADVGRALLLGTVPLAYVFDSLTIGQLYVVAVGTGSLTIFADVAYFAYVPSLLAKDELLEGNSKVAATNAVAEVGGFGAAGWLVQALTGPGAIALDAVSFLVSSVFTLGIRKPEVPAERPEAPPKLWHEVTEGVRTIVRYPVLRVLAASDVAVALSFGVFGAVYMLLVTKDLGFQPGVLGMFFAVGGVTSLLGSIYAARAGRTFGTGPTIAGGRVIMGGFMFLMVFAHDASLFAAAILIGQQLGDGFYAAADVNDTTLRQSVTPAAVLGRVNAAKRQAVLAATLVGALLGGVIGEFAGLRTALVIGCAGTLLGGAIATLPPVWGTRAIPADELGAGVAPVEP